MELLYKQLNGLKSNFKQGRGQPNNWTTW